MMKTVDVSMYMYVSLSLSFCIGAALKDRHVRSVPYLSDLPNSSFWVKRRI